MVSCQLTIDVLPVDCDNADDDDDDPDDALRGTVAARCDDVDAPAVVTSHRRRLATHWRRRCRTTHVSWACAACDDTCVVALSALATCLYHRRHVNVPAGATC